MSIVWLASYPKSGNTWVRTFLTNYVQYLDQPADINKLIGGWSYLDRALFDDIMGLSSSDMTEDEFDYYRPSFHAGLVERAGSPVFIKSHEAYRRFPNGSSLFGAVEGSKAIHLVRNPLDVAVSFAHHDDKTIDSTIKKMGNSNAKMSGGVSRFVEFMSDWTNYNESWIRQDEIPALSLRYEDMLSDTEACFAEIIQFTGLDFAEDRLKKAVTFSSFHQLKKQEKQKGFDERQATAKSFFRKGRAGDWQDALSPEQVSKIVDTHGPLMERLGYASIMTV
jgi:aryl sulfotransferase